MTTDAEIEKLAKEYCPGHRLHIIRCLGAAVLELLERLKTYQDNAAKMLARKDKLIEQACEEGIRLQVFLERLTNDFWTGCIDPQSNFALDCKRDDCLQCRLILWRKEKK